MTTLLCPNCGLPALESLSACPTCGGALHIPNPALVVGSTLRGGQYRIQGVLGQGGFGITYRAFDVGLSSEVALKELFPAGLVSRGSNQTVQVHSGPLGADYAKLKASAFAEARTLYGLRDPAVVQVLSVWEENNTVYIAMELLEGETLEGRLGRGTLSEPEATACLRSLLGALEKLHGAGVLHRDLKPENIMLSPKYGPVLIDFGTAHAFTLGKTVQFTSRVLTPAYAPLEQYASSARVGPPSDLYALAVTFYQMLSGTLPPAANDRALGAGVTPLSHLRPDLSTGFVAPLEAAMSLRTDERPQTAGVWKAALGTPTQIPAPVGQTRTVHVPPTSAPSVPVPLSASTVRAGFADPVPPKRSSGLLGGLALGLLISAGVGAGAFFWLGGQKSGERSSTNPVSQTSPVAQAKIPATLIAPSSTVPTPAPVRRVNPPSAAPRYTPPAPLPVVSPVQVARDLYPAAFVDGLTPEPGLPAPAFVKVALEPLPLRVGIPVRMSVRAVNAGESAPAGSLSVSFPRAGTLDLGSVRLIDQTALWKVERLMPGSKVLVLGYRKAQTSRDLLLEGYVDAAHGGWSGGEEKGLALEFTPVRPGKLLLYVRATVSLQNGTDPSYYRSAPLESNYQDQQSFPALPLELEVEP